jgi:hypothetical protein
MTKLCNHKLCPRKQRAYKILSEKINSFFGLEDIQVLTTEKLQKLVIESYNEAK